MNDTPATTERLAGLLAPHFDPTTCVREHGMPADEPMLAAHCAHVATVLADAGVGFVAEARAEAWDVCHRSACADAAHYESCREHANPYLGGAS